MSETHVSVGDLVDHNCIEAARLGLRPPRSVVADNREAMKCATPFSGCRVVAKASRLAETWPTDIGENLTDEQRREGRAFRVFAARVADAVMAYVLSGGRIGGGDRGCRCPLGCLTEHATNPGADYSELKLGTVGQRDSFICGFDGHRNTMYPGGKLDENYRRLGAAYRARFLRAKTEAA
jgi:hypothetical protein